MYEKVPVVLGTFLTMGAQEKRSRFIIGRWDDFYDDVVSSLKRIKNFGSFFFSMSRLREFFEFSIFHLNEILI